MALALLLMSGSPSAAVQDGIAGPKAQAKRMLALRSAAKSAMELVDGIGRSAAVDRSALSAALSEAMLADVGEHRVREQSKQLLADRLRAIRIEEFNESLDQIVSRAQDLSPLPIDRDGLLEQLGADWQKQRDAGISAYVAAAYPDLFAAAREQAVALQKERIVERLEYPQFDFVDRELVRLQKDQGPLERPLEPAVFLFLSSKLKDQSVDPKSIFEEVDSAAMDMADKIGRDLERQYQAQIEIVDQAAEQLEAIHILKDDIAAQLIGAVERATIPKPGRPPVYPVFEVIRNYGRARASQIEQERLAAFAETTELLSIDNKDIEAAVLADLQAHRSPDASRALLALHFSERLAPKLIAGYQSSSGGQLTEADLQYLKDLILAEGQSAASYRRRIGAAIDQSLSQLRREIVAQQIKRMFPGIDDEWNATEDVAEWLYEHQKSRAENFQDAIQIVDMVPDIKYSADQPLLEESEARVIESINHRASPAAAALAAQLRIVAEMEMENLEALREAVQAGKVYKDLVGDWRKDWSERWSASEPQSEFPQPFRRTSEQIEKSVRQLFDSVAEALESELVQQPEVDTGIAEPSQEQDSAEDTTEIDVVEDRSEDEGEKQVGEVLSEGASPGFAEMISGRAGYADCIFLFSDVGDGACGLEFGTPDLAVSKNFQFSPGQIEAVADSLAAAMAEDLVAIARAKAEAYKSGFRIPIFGRKNPPEMAIYVRVDSRRLRHLTMLQLRTKLQEQLDARAEEYELPSLEIDWKEWRSLPDD